MKMVVAGTESQEMILVGSAAIVFALDIGLYCRLRGQEVRARAEDVNPGCEAIRITTDGQLNPWSRIENARTIHGVCDPVLEFGVAEAQAVGKVAAAEIHAHDVAARVVDIGKWLKRVRDKGQNTLVLVVGEAIENFISADLPIQFSERLGLTEGRIEVAGKADKGPPG